MHFLAFLMSLWCYAISLTIVMYVIPYRLTRNRFHYSLRLGVFLFAVMLLVRGAEAWGVASSGIPIEAWYFVNAISPAAATVIIVGGALDVARKRSRLPKKRSGKRKPLNTGRVFKENVA